MVRCSCNLSLYSGTQGSWVCAALERCLRSQARSEANEHVLQVAPCDRILVMHAGRIVDGGSHAELLARPGWYADTWRAQHAAAA